MPNRSRISARVKLSRRVSAALGLASVIVASAATVASVSETTVADSAAAGTRSFVTTAPVSDEHAPLFAHVIFP
jgi:hypothetical protein